MYNILTNYFIRSKVYFSNFDDYVHKTDHSKIRAVNRVNIPSSEDGAFETVGKVFNLDIQKDIFVETLSATRIWEEDKVAIDVYCREKNFDDGLDVHALDRAFSHLFYLCGFDNFSFNPILDYDFCYNILPKSTSSGYPLYVKKSDAINVKYTFEKFNEFFNTFNLKHIHSKLSFYPTTIFHRFTPKVMKTNFRKFKYKVRYKIRQIFGVSHLISLIEVSLLYRYIERLKAGLKDYITIGLTKSEVSDRISSIRNEAILTNRKIYCGDIKGCDMSIIPNFHYAFFGLLIDSSKFSPYTNHLISLANYLTNTPILMKGGKFKRSCGSTTSGSWTTSVFTTFCILTVCFYSYYMIYNRLPSHKELQVQGDDFIMLIKDDDDMKLFKSMFKEFNLRLRADHVDVVNYDGNIEFLGYYWDCMSAPFQTDQWVITRILFPERRVDLAGPDRIIYRYLSIIFQLRNFLDLFKRFVIFDKYLKRKLMGNKDPTFQIVDSTGVLHKAKWPLESFLNYGWRMF